MENQMYSAIDNGILHTDDDAFRKNSKIAQRTTAGGKRSGLAEGDVGYRIGKSNIDYNKYEVPLRIEQLKLKKLVAQLSLLKMQIDGINRKRKAK